MTHRYHKDGKPVVTNNTMTENIQYIFSFSIFFLSAFRIALIIITRVRWSRVHSAFNNWLLYKQVPWSSAMKTSLKGQQKVVSKVKTYNVKMSC